MAKEKLSNQNRRKFVIDCIKLTALVAIAITLYIIPEDMIYNGESLCLYKNIFDTECWGCGTTRAVFSTMHLDFAQAWEYNRNIVVVFPLLVWVYCREVWKCVAKLRSLRNPNA